MGDLEGLAALRVLPPAGRFGRREEVILVVMSTRLSSAGSLTAGSA
jgi:hypothetical protein